MLRPEELIRRIAGGRPPLPLADQIFQNATNFHESAQRCFEDRAAADGRHSFPIMPGVVGLAFACELYIKALIVWEAEAAKAPHSHRLNVLFARLTTETRQLVEERYLARRRGLHLVFTDDLLTFSNAFVDFRYVYEGNAGRMDIVGLGHLAASLYETAVQLRPDLRTPEYLHSRFTAAAQGIPMFGGVAPPGL